MDLDQLIAGVGIQRVSPVVSGRAAAVRICDITEDSRTVMPGSLFIARRGEKSDGRAFAAGAVHAGAAAVLTDDKSLRLPGPSAMPPGSGGAELLLTEDLPRATARLAERFYGDPSTRVATIGVTGTNGKTTTTWLIHQVLNTLGLRCGLMGTICIDDGSETAPASLTTPPALEVSRTLARMHECGCRACAMEASSHALQQGRVAGVRFRVAVFTNLTHDHLDYHGDMESYGAAKALLFESLRDADTAIVNADDPASGRMLAQCGARVVACSLGAARSAQWTGKILESTLAGMRCAVRGPGHVEREIRLPFIGAHNVMNALQAAAACVAIGAEAEAVLSALEHAKAPPGRLEMVTSWDDPLAVYVDYAHTDDALERVLAVGRGALQARAGGSAGGRLVVVFGCGGDRDRAKRPKMGALAARAADRAIITSDNPRTEDPREIVAEIRAGIAPADRAKVTIELDRAAAINAAIAQARPGDFILIAGKGHEDYQLTPDGRGGILRSHFDDREVARAALQARGDIPSLNPEEADAPGERRGPRLKPAATSTGTKPHRHAGRAGDAPPEAES
ncbi:UDP-N-acetylmuramoyl-L-alanyl-D-glutamate--2,6-diaminopimelate ligase [soil metagenome]